LPLELTDRPSLAQPAVLGISGGLVPCPSALVVPVEFHCLGPDRLWTGASIAIQFGAAGALTG